MGPQPFKSIIEPEQNKYNKTYRQSIGFVRFFWEKSAFSPLWVYLIVQATSTNFFFIL